MINIIDQLVHFYFNYDWSDGNYLSESQVKNTIQHLLDKERIITCVDNEGNLLGYIESWRINYAQLGWFLCGKRFDVSVQDINNGNICYVANITVHPDFQESWVMNYLKSEFFKKNFMCEFFIGQARRKKHQPLKVFKRQEFMQKFLSKEVQYG